MTILNLLQLNEFQLQAAAASGHLVVTAGAGSGKTRTLVGRYLALLEAGAPLREIVAITFTDKAAREMRNRIRQTIADWLAQDPPQRAFWESAFADLDAARIGTIHSLCAQILREHPVEAARLGIMPGSGVLEEGRAAVLRARAVEEALAWAAQDEAASHLFRALAEFGLREAVSTLLEKRLDAGPAFDTLRDDPLQGWADALQSWLDEQLETPEWQGVMDDLSGWRANDPNDEMEIARQAVLAHAQELDAARGRRDFDAALAELAALRAATSLKGRKGNWPGDTLASVKDAMRALREYFDERLAPLADPGKPARWILDEHVGGIIWLLRSAYQHALDFYAQARRAENALDFDDLEAGALALLQAAPPDAQRIRAVLVDEFQDTNERQRRIVYALANFGTPQHTSSLFVVGDSKQSIYRFRGADVTVFRRVQDDIARADGQVIPLDLTFRAHGALVETTNRLLAPILGQTGQPGRPYQVPFAPLVAFRREPRPGLAAPFVELHLGLGQSAAEGRRAAADGLAARLLDLRARESVEWRDVALLFRASTSFPVYEDALERANIPFVTVAGRGFYERPEVRDLLNAMLAVADPSDDLALVGLLRSPAVGLSDAALYLLRFAPISGQPTSEGDLTPKRCSIWSVLNHPMLADIVPPDDLPRALRGRELVNTLHNLAGRAPVAALLKQLLDQTHYRAALQSIEGGARAQRNIDKLLADAHASELVSAREFAEYVQTLREVGARESEAPTEAGSAVQLMTVHKAKGLEFPIVVIADAAHAGHRGSADILLDDQLGVAINLRDEQDNHPAIHRLAALRNAERDEAQDRRLLYVAATRAQEKLLVSAHTKILKGGTLSVAGWLERLGQVVGLDSLPIAGTPLEPQHLPLADDVACVLYPWKETSRQVDEGATPYALLDTHPRAAREPSPQYLADMAAPLVSPPSGNDPKLDARESDPPHRVWRVAPRGPRPQAPAWVVGTLVHTALRHWRFGAGLESFLRPFALEMGVVSEKELGAAVREATRLLQRFRAHPFWAELDQARRWHELPYSLLEEDSLLEEGRPQHGIIDLLYRAGSQYRIVEFKTDELRAGADLQAHILAQRYDEQVRRYVRAVQAQLGDSVRASLVFLNAGRAIAIVPV